MSLRNAIALTLLSSVSASHYSLALGCDGSDGQPSRTALETETRYSLRGNSYRTTFTPVDGVSERDTNQGAEVEEFPAGALLHSSDPVSCEHLAHSDIADSGIGSLEPVQLPSEEHLSAQMDSLSIEPEIRRGIQVRPFDGIKLARLLISFDDYDEAEKALGLAVSFGASLESVKPYHEIIRASRARGQGSVDKVPRKPDTVDHFFGPF